MLVSAPIVCFIGALITDIMYAATIGVLAAIAGLIDLLSSRTIRSLMPAWPHALGNVLVLVLAFFNALIHTRDARTSVVPTGLILSIITGLILPVTGWLGWAMVYRYGVDDRDRHRWNKQRSRNYLSRPKQRGKSFGKYLPPPATGDSRLTALISKRRLGDLAQAVHARRPISAIAPHYHTTLMAIPIVQSAIAAVEAHPSQYSRPRTAKSPITLRLRASSISITMTGAANTPLMTALQ